jgi:hypothetical protein
MHMAKWWKKSVDTATAPEREPERETTPETESETATSERTTDRGRGRRARSGNGVRAGVKRISDAAATAVRIIAMVICVLLALHIAFVVFTANEANSIVRSVNDWADWFAWRFRDIFVPKDRRVGVLVNYGIAAVVYLIAGRVAAGLIRRIR